MNEIPIHTEYIPLNSFLKHVGLVGTGGEANMLIANGRIRVDGEVETRLRRKLYPDMTVQAPGGETYTVIRNESAE